MLKQVREYFLAQNCRNPRFLAPTERLNVLYIKARRPCSNLFFALGGSGCGRVGSLNNRGSRISKCTSLCFARVNVARVQMICGRWVSTGGFGQFHDVNAKSTSSMRRCFLVASDNSPRTCCENDRLLSFFHWVSLKIRHDAH